MHLRFRFARAVGATLALTLGATAAAAQTDSTRIPVRKDRPATPTTERTPVRKDTPATPAPTTPAPTTPAPETTPAPTPTPVPTPTPTPTVDSSAMRRDSTVTTTTSTTVSTGESTQPMMPAAVTRFGNGLYFGIAAGASVPRGGLARRVHETSGGYNAAASLGWDPTRGPLGLRLDLEYNRLSGREYRTSAAALSTYDNTNVFGATGEAKLRLPFGRLNGSTSGLYLIGGGGVHHITNYSKLATLARVTTNDQSIDASADNTTNASVNGGAGIGFGLGRAELFLESRYVRIFTPGRKTDYAPIVLGVNFF